MCICVCVGFVCINTAIKNTPPHPIQPHAPHKRHKIGTGDDTVDLGPQFQSWLDSLWPALCEAYAQARVDVMACCLLCDVNVV